MNRALNVTLYPIIITRRYIRRVVDSILAKATPKLYASIKHHRIMHKWIDWENPQDINEKINWLKFNSDTTEWSRLADKYRVRDYIEEKGLSQILVKLYGMWERAEDIDWNSLPSKFVMKVNNGSGDILVCRDKSKLNRESVVEEFNRLLKLSFYHVNSEPHYAKIKPCIIAEELLDSKKQDIKTHSLIDYKVWCLDGEPHHIWTAYDRTNENVKVSTYDLDWNYHPEYSVFYSHYSEAPVLVPKPKCYDEMLNAARILSKGFPQVRIDFYCVGDRLYFGEMTFTSAGGFMCYYTKEFLLEMGSKVTI